MNDDGTPVAKATTDETGRFRIPEAPSGSFLLTPFAPAFVLDDRTAWGQPGKLVTIANGEALEPNLYRIEARLPGDQWFVRSLTLPAPAKGKPPIDAARDGVAISPGQQVTGLTVTLAEGAATLRGRIVAERQGANLPKRVRVHLIPVEKESADEVLRFFEASAQADGTFELTNIEPGRYWMLALASEEDESSVDRLRPRAWDAAVRSKLRSAGETANDAIEFQPCQRMKDQVLRLATNVRLSPNQNRRERRPR